MFSAGLWAFLQSIIVRGVTSFSFFALGFFIAPEQFGLFAIASAFILFAELLCEQAVTQVVVQLNTSSKSVLNAAFYFGLCFGLFISLILYSLADVVALYFNNNSLIDLIKLASLCPLLCCLYSVPSAILRINYDFKSLAKRSMISSFISSLISIVLAYLGYGAKALVIQSIVYYFLSCSILWITCNWRPSFELLNFKSNVVSILKLWWLNTCLKLSDYVESKGLELIIGSCLGITQLGYYSFANKIAQTIFQTFATPVFDLLFPKVATSKHDKIASIVHSMSLLYLFIPAFILLYFSVTISDLLNLSYGDKWVTAYPTIVLLLVSCSIRGFSALFGTTFTAMKIQKISIFVSAFRTSLTILFLYLFLNILNTSSTAALSYLLSSILILPMNLFFFTRILKVPVTQLAKILIKFVFSFGVSLSPLILFYSDSSLLNILLTSLLTFAGFNIFILLNSGYFSYSLYNLGTDKKLVRILKKYVDLLSFFRQQIAITWFKYSLRFSLVFHKIFSKRKIQSDSVLIVPADTRELIGSLGDQALLNGFYNIKKFNSCFIVTSKAFNAKNFTEIKYDIINCWESFGSGFILGSYLNRVSGVYVIGADVMDGYYSSSVSRMRIILANEFAKIGVESAVMGFSFNEKPNPDVIAEFAATDAKLRICLRDPISYQRFIKFVPRDAFSVADLAFHMTPSSYVSEIQDTIHNWVTPRKLDGKNIIAININPQVVAHLDIHAADLLAKSLATTISSIIPQGNAIILVPHDFRPGCGDLLVLDKVKHHLDTLSIDQTDILLVRTRFVAQEIKASCKYFDLVFSARMHFAIAALSSSVPVCGMQYQGKFQGLFKLFNMPADIFISPEDSLDSAKLTSFLEKHINNIDGLKSLVVQKLPEVIALSAKNVSM